MPSPFPPLLALSLRGDSARALRDTLNVNGSLQDLNLSYNGFSDGDAALVLMGLSNHGHWRRIDLSYNNLGAGSALVLSELLDLLGKKAAELVSIGAYGESWDLVGGTGGSGAMGGRHRAVQEACLLRTKVVEQVSIDAFGVGWDMVGKGGFRAMGADADRL